MICRGSSCCKAGARAARRRSELGGRFLPTAYQGVPLRSQGDPILNIASPKGVTPERQRRTIDAIRDLNLKRLVETGDQEIATRISLRRWRTHAIKRARN